MGIKNNKEVEKPPYDKTLARVALFHDIDPQERSAMLSCLGSVKTAYRKDEIIWLEGAKVEFVGVVLTGVVQIVKEDRMGKRMIQAEVSAGDLFGEALACVGLENHPFTVVAAEACEILFLPLKRILTTCGKNCGFHAKLIENTVRLLAHKNIMLVQKMELLSQRTIRDKLIAYLEEQRRLCGAMNFTIPFSRADLADFLCVDRSALSRELGKMRDEGMLRFEKNEFVLLAWTS